VGGKLASIRQRIEALESRSQSQATFADCLESATRRWLALTSEEREARRIATMRHALATPEPGHPLKAALWRAQRRLARFYGVAE
jgi:hypothetical protein